MSFQENVILRDRLLAVDGHKMGDFEEVDEHHRIEMTKDEIARLPVIIANSDEMGSPMNNLPRSFFDVTKNVLLILVRDGRKYLVSTEGYDYCRYIARIKVHN